MDSLSIAKTKIQNYFQYTDENTRNAILKQLKLMMLNFKSLPPSTHPIIVEEFLVAREILEIEMEKYLNARDTKNFELAYLKIKQFYFDYKGVLPKSERMLYFVGLYLLHLLANNRTTEFCTELELLDVADLNSPYVRISRDLETCIMEGNYKHIQNIKSESINLPHYKDYLEKFDNAIRFQIARSAEKSYESLSLNDAFALLMLNNVQELNSFIKYDNESREAREIDWQISYDRVHFIPINRDKLSIPAQSIIEDTITLATEIEKII
jgi:26S proteasome regulatory subunit N12